MISARLTKLNPIHKPEKEYFFENLSIFFHIAAVQLTYYIIGWIRYRLKEPYRDITP